MSQEYAPEELNKALWTFFTEIRKQAVTNYDLNSFRVTLAAPDRKLFELGCPRSIKKEQEFDECHRGKSLRIAKGWNGQKKRSLTKEEQEISSSSGVLTKSSPPVLISTVLELDILADEDIESTTRMDYFLTS